MWTQRARARSSATERSLSALPNLSNWLAIVLWFAADAGEEERVSAVVSIGSEMLLTVAALLALRVVTLLTDRQSERAAARERMAVPAAPAPV